MAAAAGAGKHTAAAVGAPAATAGAQAARAAARAAACRRNRLSFLPRCESQLDRIVHACACTFKLVCRLS